MNTPTSTTSTTAAERQAAIAVVQAIAEALRSLGQVPSGHFYVRLQAMPLTSSITLGQYQALLDALEAAKLIAVKNHLITWTGPKA